MDKLQQELTTKLYEGIKPSDIKNSKAFIFQSEPSLNKNNSLNNLGKKTKHFTQSKEQVKTQPAISQETSFLVKYWKELLVIGGIGLLGYLLLGE